MSRYFESCGTSAVAAVTREVTRQEDKFQPFHSKHEMYGVLSEEVYELLQALHANQHEQFMKEAKQCAAVCIRFLEECTDVGYTIPEE